MSEFTEYLGGKVQRQVLPVLTDPRLVAASARKRIALPQGELAQIYSDSVGIHYIACVELSGSFPRGNHYHRNKEEWIYVMRGKVRLVVENVESRERESLECPAGDLVVVYPGIAHAVHVLEPGLAVEFSPQEFDPADVVRYPL
ncbi:MAG: cupin domain-containing protein [Verrucomicrobiota bacterium]